MALLTLLATLYPALKIGGEFMPPLDEGDLLYMPSALPGISASTVSALLQQTKRLIKTVAEVASVFGKASRAETATDPAPLEMFETTIQFKPREQWRPGMTPDKLVPELDHAVHVPGRPNIWVPPIRNRIDMLATGIKSPVGVKVAGTNLQEVDRLASDGERVVKHVPGVSSAFAERLTGGRYIDVHIDRDRAARYGLNISDVQSVVSTAIGAISDLLHQVRSTCGHRCWRMLWTLPCRARSSNAFSAGHSIQWVMPADGFRRLRSRRVCMAVIRSRSSMSFRRHRLRCRHCAGEGIGWSSRRTGSGGTSLRALQQLSRPTGNPIWSANESTPRRLARSRSSS